jgi:hypothetical protein
LEPKTAESLLIDVHHIVGDGVSTPLMLKRLNALYCGGELPPPELTYKDYASGEKAAATTPGLEDWKKHLLPLPEKLDMPADLPRPHPFDFKGGVCEFTLPDELAARCDSFCAERELTPFMLFSAAWGLLLSRASGKDLCWWARRFQAETAASCGMSAARFCPRFP